MSETRHKHEMVRVAIKGCGFATYRCDCGYETDGRYDDKAEVESLELELAKAATAIEQLQATARIAEDAAEVQYTKRVEAEVRARKAEAKLAEYKEDAERYRVLHNGDLPNYAVMSCYEGDDRWSTIDGDNLDRAIDAAKRKEGKE